MPVARSPGWPVLTCWDMKSLMTLGEAALALHTTESRLRKLFAEKLLPEPERIGVMRVVRADQLDAVRQALHQRFREPIPA